MRNSMYLFLSGVMTNATMGIYYPVLARFLTVEEMGEMVSLSLVFVFFSILFPFSLQQASIYFSSMYLGQGDEERAWGSWRGFRNVGAFVSIVAGSSGYLLINAMLALLGITNLLFGLILTINLTIVIIRTFIASAIYPKERFDVAFYFNGADLALRVPTTLLLVVWGWGLFGVLFGWIAGDALRLCLYSIWTHRNVPRFRAQYLHRESMEYASPLWGATLLTYFADNIERFVLVIALGGGELAIYTAALIAYNVLQLGLGAISLSIFPKLAALGQQEDRTQLNLVTSKAVKFTLLIFLPLACL